MSSEQVEFGTLVEIAIAIHPRIIDLWNYDLVLSALSSDDRAEVIDRLGCVVKQYAPLEAMASSLSVHSSLCRWQNTWSPLKPDGAYSLNLSNKNDRLVAKALIHLEAAESSRRLKGFTDVTFQRTRETEPVIGFVMPKAWLSRSGLPTQGILTVRYSSEVSLEERRPPLKLEIHDDAHGGPGSPVEKKKKKKRTIDKNTASRLQLKLKAAIRGQSPADLFRKYDATGDDLLDETELLRLIRVDLKIMPGELTDEDVGMLVTNLDDDGSGTLSIPELVDFVERGVATFNSGPLKIDTAVAEKLLKALRGATTYQKVFGKFDTSGDGKLDAGELLALVRDDLNILSDEVADQDVRSLAVALDDDGSGTLSIEELASFVEFGTDAIAIGRSSNIDKSIANQIQAAMKAATTHTKLFAEFDASGDGLLNPSELNRMIRKDLKVLPAEVSDADIGLLVKALDDDGSGTLAIHELVDFIEHGTATFFAAGAEKKIGDAVANRLQTALKEATAGVSPLELLKEFDESGDGNLNAHEFVKLVRTDLKIAEDQVTDEDIATLVKALDDDGSATVGIHELADFIERGTATFGEGPEKIDEEAALKLQKRLQRALKGKDPQSFFESFDDSGDGMLDANELMLLIRTALKISAEDISDNDVSILVRALDDDGSGTLAIDEIIDFVEKVSYATFDIRISI
jgi:Ca2+-binding EF-hand superfamily protein